MANRGRPRSFDRSIALERAMQLFWERGYEAVSLADLTDTLGLNKPSIYAAFGSKEALFREAVALYVATEGNATPLAMRDELTTARTAVEAMLRNNARAYTAPGKPRGCMVVHAASIGSVEARAVREFLGEIRQQTQQLIVKRLQRGVREGDVAAAADPLRIARFYGAVLGGLSLQARDQAPLTTLTTIIDDAMAAWDVVTRERPAPSTASGRRRAKTSKS